jgi:hypothetical protein
MSHTFENTGTLYGAGPRTIEEANAHRADERVKLADLHRATEVVALALLDLLRRQASRAAPGPGLAHGAGWNQLGGRPTLAPA